MSAIPSLAQLKQAVLLCEQIEKLQLELEALLDSTRVALASSPKAAGVTKPRRMPTSGSRVSAQGSQRIAAAQRRRWDRFRRARQEAAEQKVNGGHNGSGNSNGMHKSAEESAAEN